MQTYLICCLILLYIKLIYLSNNVIITRYQYVEFDGHVPNTLPDCVELAANKLYSNSIILITNDTEGK